MKTFQYILNVKSKKKKVYEDFLQLYTFNVTHHSLSMRPIKDVKHLIALCILKRFQHYFCHVNVG